MAIRNTNLYIQSGTPNMWEPSGRQHVNLATVRGRSMLVLRYSRTEEYNFFFDKSELSSGERKYIEDYVMDIKN